MNGKCREGQMWKVLIGIACRAFDASSSRKVAAFELKEKGENVEKEISLSLKYLSVQYCCSIFKRITSKIEDYYFRNLIFLTPNDP